MKVILLIAGVTSTVIAILPFFFAYPYSDGPNSGPSNLWELILMISYEGQKWYLLAGIAFLFVLCLFHFKQRKI